MDIKTDSLLVSVLARLLGSTVRLSCAVVRVLLTAVPVSAHSSTLSGFPSM